MVKTKKGSEKIINYILNTFIVIFGITLLITIYTGVQTKIFKKKYSDFFGYTIFEVKTGSMSGTIEIGDWIVVKLTNDVKLNDIITYEYQGEFITHRVIEVYNNSFVTMGDSNTAKDLIVDRSQVTGKVVKILSSFGIFRKTIFNPVVLIALIVTLFLFDMAFKKNKKDDHKIKEKKIKEKKLPKERKPKTEKEESEVIVKELNTPEENKKYYDFSDYTEEDNYEEEEIEKTSLYRFVPVDMSEVDETLLEIAENEMKEADIVPVKKEEIQEEVKEEKILDKINLKLLNSQKLSKKSKNIVEKILVMKTEEINEIVSVLVPSSSDSVDKKLKELFVTSYVEARYNNYFGDDDLPYNGSNLTIKIEKFIKSITVDIKNEYDAKYADKIDYLANTVMLIANLEEAKDSVKDAKAKNQYYKKEMLKYYRKEKWDNNKCKYITDKILDIQRNYNGIIDYVLKKFDTSTFELDIIKLTSIKNTFAVKLKHNITFSKIYSEYIIDKTYSEGLIAEEKMKVLLTMLLVEIARDMLNGAFNKKYVIYYPASLYEKDKKFALLLKLFDDDYAKDHILVLTGYSEAINNKKLIKSQIKAGYKFALVFDESADDIKDLNDIYLYENIFVNKKSVNIINKLENMSDEVNEKILYENIVDKINDDVEGVK